MVKIAIFEVMDSHNLISRKIYPYKDFEIWYETLSVRFLKIGPKFWVLVPTTNRIDKTKSNNGILHLIELLQTYNPFIKSCSKTKSIT